MALTKFVIIIWLMLITTVQYTPTGFKRENSDVGITNNQVQNDTPIPAKLFTKSDADRILGSSTYMIYSVSKVEESMSSYLCGYKANKKDEKTGKFGAIYFFFEVYNDIDGAKKRVKNIHLSNKPHGIEDVTHLGDEAFYHTDGQNFDLIMVRKSNYVFNVKVNKRTSTTSLNAFKKTIQRIAESI
jgi:hypothetical protein